jgi:hypothetical protein
MITHIAPYRTGTFSPLRQISKLMQRISKEKYKFEICYSDDIALDLINQKSARHPRKAKTR